jgi:hypothetical protein
MTPQQKTRIAEEFTNLWKGDFGDVEKSLEYAHQVLAEKNAVIYALPNSEIINAIAHAREGLNAQTFERATLQLAYARRHFYRARYMYLAVALSNLEKRIFKLLKEMGNSKDPKIAKLRLNTKRLKSARRRMPKLKAATAGGPFKLVNAGNLKLHREITEIGRLLLIALNIYRALIEL